MTPEQVMEQARKGTATKASTAPVDNSDLFATPEQAELIQQDRLKAPMGTDRFSAGADQLLKTPAIPISTGAPSMEGILAKKQSGVALSPAELDFIGKKTASMSPEAASNFSRMVGDVESMPTARETFVPAIPKPKEKLFEAMGGNGAPAPEKAEPVVPEVKYEKQVIPGMAIAPKTAGANVTKDSPVSTPVIEKLAAEAKKPSSGIGQKIRDLAVKFGVPILEIIEAGAKGYAGNTTQLAVDKKYQAKLEQKQNDYIANLAKERETSDQARARREAQEANDEWTRRHGIEAATDSAMLRQEAALRGTPQAKTPIDIASFYGED